MQYQYSTYTCILFILVVVYSKYIICVMVWCMCNICSHAPQVWVCQLGFLPTYTQIYLMHFTYVYTSKQYIIELHAYITVCYLSTYAFVARREI